MANTELHLRMRRVIEDMLNANISGREIEPLPQPARRCISPRCACGRALKSVHEVDLGPLERPAQKYLGCKTPSEAHRE
jgi:hypothetical protein